MPMADIHLNIIELKAQVKRCALPGKPYTVRVQD